MVHSFCLNIDILEHFVKIIKLIVYIETNGGNLKTVSEFNVVEKQFEFVDQFASPFQVKSHIHDHFFDSKSFFDS